MDINLLKFNDYNDFNFLKISDIIKLKEWFNKFNKIKNLNHMENEKIILITGESCCFKTTFAKFLCRHNNFEDKSFNAIDMRGDKSIKDFIHHIGNNKNIINMMYNKPDRLCIILDDIDTSSNSSDKVIISDLLELFNNKKKNKKNIKFYYPIICICSNSNEKKLNELKKYSLEINIPSFDENDYKNYLIDVLKINNIYLSDNKIDKIIKNIDYDFRKILFFIKDILMISTNNTISNEIINMGLKTFSKKNSNNLSSNNISKIFEDKISIKDSIKIFYNDKFLFPFLIHENYIYSFLSYEEIKYEEVLEYIKDISYNLSKNDVLQNLIFEKQLWELNNISAILTISQLNYSMFRLLKKNNLDVKKFTKRKYTTLLNKVSLFYTNRKVYSNLLSNYGIRCFDIYLLSEVICNLIINKTKKDAIDILKSMILKYNLTIDSIDLLVRVYKFDTVDIKKFYTCKLKNELKKIN